MPKKAQGDVVKLLNYDSETSQVLSTDISHINIPIDPSKDLHNTLGGLLTTNTVSLSRTFNTRIGRQASIEVIKSLFNLNVDYSKIRNISYGEGIKRSKKYPYPKTLNKKTTPEVIEQINKITAHTLNWYEGKSIDFLLSGALPTQTFWDFALACLKSGIKLAP